MVVLEVRGGREMDLWLVGKLLENGRWEFAGVFDTEVDAIDHCLTEMYFIGPCILNERVPEETTVWPGAYCPLSNVQAT